MFFFLRLSYKLILQYQESIRYFLQKHLLLVARDKEEKN